MMLVMLVGGFCYVFQFLAVERSNRVAKRLANNALAPVLTVMSESVQGRGLARVLRCEEFFINKMANALNEYNKFNYFSLTVINWGAFVTNGISFFVSFAAALLVVMQRETRFTNPAAVGVSLTYSFLLPYFLQILSMVLSFFASGLTSLERILQYRGKHVPQEPPWLLP